MYAFLPCGGRSLSNGLRTPGRGAFTSRCIAPRSVRQSRRVRNVPQASMASTLLVADDIYGQIFLGGLTIIMAGIVGTVIVGLLIRRNYEEVRSRGAAFEQRLTVEDLISQLTRSVYEYVHCVLVQCLV